MKKSQVTRPDPSRRKLALRSETVRILTEREITLVAAGNCVHASVNSQSNLLDPAGAC